MDLVVREVFEESVGDLSQAETLRVLHHERHDSHSMQHDRPDFVVPHAAQWTRGCRVHGLCQGATDFHERGAIEWLAVVSRKELLLRFQRTSLCWMLDGSRVRSILLPEFWVMRCGQSGSRRVGRQDWLQ